MAWTVLLLSALFEAVWATALGMSNGFTEIVPTIVFAIALAISMAGLGWAMRRIPIGTAYAVWTGLGAALTVAYAMATGVEAVSAAKLVFLAMIIGAVVGLKLVPSGSAGTPIPAGGGAEDPSPGDRDAATRPER